MTRGLGRLPSVDVRDKAFPIRAMISEALPVLTPDQEKAKVRGYRMWYDGSPFLDQGNWPACVGYAWAHWLAAGPTRNLIAGRTEYAAAIYAKALYKAAQQIDEWPGEDYEGTSVRAGVKVLRDEGYVTEFRWATELSDVVEAVLLFGPVVVGTDWYSGMDQPTLSTSGRAIMFSTGRLLGGHAFLVTGVNEDTGLFRIKNSWGRDWANGGRAWMNIEAMANLLFSHNGEACLAVEKAVKS